MRVPVDLRKSYRLINHGPVTLITSTGENRANVMAASWVVPVDFDPARVALVIGNESLTFENVMSSEEMVINVPTVDMIEAVHEAGNTSGARGRQAGPARDAHDAGVEGSCSAH